MKKLLLVIFLEGYAVLSVELLAIRQLIPYVDSATDTISVIVAAVLMPLAFGYYAGGRFKGDVNAKLLQNLAIATAVLTIGLSYVFIEFFFGAMFDIGLKGRVLQTALYSLLFIAGPVFLLGQTVPLVTNFFPEQRLPTLTGKILFISTLGSFMGAVFCTLVLMATIGVHHSVTISIACLAILTLLLSKKKIAWQSGLALGCFAVAALLNSGAMMKKHDIVSNNQYHTVKITDISNGGKLLTLNNTVSARFNDKPEGLLPYMFFIENNFIGHMDDGTVKDILVIGAGGFVLGNDDLKNNYIYLDINPELKKIAEEEFLQEPLAENKIFEAKPARAYLSSSDKKFDLIIIDTFYGYNSIPEHLITREFFQQLKDALKQDGIVVANFAGSPNFANEFSANIDATFRAVFPHVNREVIDFYNGWQREADHYTNILYSYFHQPMPDAVYTDDLNRSYYDRGKIVD